MENKMDFVHSWQTWKLCLFNILILIYKDTYCCPACSTLSPLLNIFRLCKSDSIPAVQVSIRDTLSKLTKQWALLLSHLGLKDTQSSILYLVSCSLLAVTDIPNGEENHQRLKEGTGTKKDIWESGAKPSRLVLPRTWMQMTENDKGELN